MRNGRQSRSFSQHLGLGTGLDTRDTRDTRDTSDMREMRDTREHKRMFEGQRNKNILLALRSRWQRALGSRLKRDPDAGMYGFIKKTVRYIDVLIRLSFYTTRLFHSPALADNQDKSAKCH